MKSLVIFLCICLFGFGTSSQVNLISNPSFEQPNLIEAVCDNIPPLFQRQIFHDWFIPSGAGTVGTIQATFLFGPGLFYPCRIGFDGIPRNSDSFQIYDEVPLTVPDNFFGTQSPFTGDQYAGLIYRRYKFIQGVGGSPETDKGFMGIELTEPLVCGGNYRVTYLAARMDMTEFDDADPKYKLTFSSDINQSQRPSGVEKNVFSGEEEITGTEWAFQSFDFFNDQDEELNYFFFRITNNFPVVIVKNKLAGMYIDEVVVYDKCLVLNPCSPVGGAIKQPEITQPHTGFVDGWFKIDNLDNISSIKVEIETIGGAELRTFTVNSTNGITEPVYWNGKSNGGAEIPNQVLTYRLTLTNVCGIVDDNICINLTGQFVKENTFPTVPPPVTVYNNSGVVTPRACCSNQLDINIDNVTLSGPGLLEYVALNNINVAQSGNVTLTSNAEVSMKAGNEISFGPGFSVNSGAEFSAIIDECDPTPMFNPPQVNETANVLGSTGNPNNGSEPNSSGILAKNIGESGVDLQNSMQPNQKHNLTVYDLTGRTMLTRFDYPENIVMSSKSELCPGTYILRSVRDGIYTSDRFIIARR